MPSIFKRSKKKGEPYTIQYFDHLGKRKTVQGFTDKGLTEELAKKLEGEVRLRATGLVDPAMDELAKARNRPLNEILDQFEKSLVDCTSKHLRLTMYRVKRVLNGCQFKTIGDVDGARIQEYLQQQRSQKRFGHRTYNHYLQGVGSFLNWCVSAKLLSSNPLSEAERLNIEVDVRHQRRALTPQEVRKLIETAAASNRSFQKQSPETRVRIYSVAYMTGLRKQELASLTPASFKLDDAPPTVTVQATRSKHRKKDVLPLHPQLVELLRIWLKDMPVDQPLFPGLARKKLSNMVRLDLALAGIPYKTIDGIADFHAAGRHTYITQLIRSGAPLPTAMELARHSDVKMTMRYTHIGIDDQADALKKLPTPHADDRALHGRCISGGADSTNVAQTATTKSEHSKKKRRKSNQESDFGVSCHCLASTIRAEGTGIEPATPYGALHFQ